MFDRVLRPAKDLLVSPLVRLLAGRIHPVVITLAAAIIGLAAAACAGLGALHAAAVLWLVNRVVDGLDGAVARAGGTQSDLGGYLDLLLDVVVYSAIPVGLALHLQNTQFFVAVMILLSAFYINITSWLYLSALMEKRASTVQHGVSPGIRSTAIFMPRGLIEGTETIVFYLAVLLLPRFALPIVLVMAAGTIAGALQRLFWALDNID